MKSTLFLSGILISLLAGSCQKAERAVGQTSLQTVTNQPKADEIVRDTVTNKEGIQLVMAFNNTRQTATFILNGETIKLKHNPTASGINYSNAEYEYTEHQGEMTLRKDRKIVFSYRK